jgi:radical SAM superfamily enzyme YgiQ (UPF0313 family)
VLTLINTNRMMPPIGPVGLDYVAGAARHAGMETHVLDLCLADDPETALARYFAVHSPALVGLSFRNVDDCFWPSGTSFVPQLVRTVREIRRLTDAPIALGGVGYSIFPERLLDTTGADFGVRGDGEKAIVDLVSQLRRERRFEEISGLVWRRDRQMVSNAPAWPERLRIPASRDAIDNATYFRRGGQGGLETKRGCNRKCIYCADPLAKGTTLRLREPPEVADEIEALLAQGVDVLHLCDSEFNIPIHHATAVCEEIIRRQLGEKLRWYAYLAAVPFDLELADVMRRAGCVGINFTSDAGCPEMLQTYRQPHRAEHLAEAVRLCKQNGIVVMLDMLLGGPGETPETLAETIRVFKEIDPDCAGAALGVRVYPNTRMAEIVASEGPPEENPSIRRRYDGPVDTFLSTFYISAALGENPAQLVHDLIGDDARFFPPSLEADGGHAGEDHNYNENPELTASIADGARGAYWDILRKQRT